MSLAALAALLVIAQLGLLIVILLVIDAPAIRTANRLLAAILLIIGGNLLLFFWKESGTTPFPDYYRRVLYIGCLAIAPLLLFYTQAMVQPSFRVHRSQLWHFAPVLLLLLASLPAAGLFSDPQAGAHVSTDDSPRLVWLTSLVTLLASAWGTVYALAGLRLIARYQRGLRDRFSSLEAVSLRWLRRILYLFVGMNLVLVPVALLRIVVGGALHPVLYVMLPTSVLLLYYVAIAGFRRAQLFYAQPVIAHLLDEPLAAPEPPDADSSTESKTKYARSGLDEGACRQFWQELTRLMVEQKPYLDDQLQLAALAERLGISTHELSQVLSTCAEQNFYDFVNGYRVREVQALMAEPANRDCSLLQLAEDAGFRSKSTFNKYFKGVTGMTPGEYRGTLSS